MDVDIFAEVMKGLVAKKQAKMRKNGIELADSEGLKEAEILARRSQQEKEKTHQVIYPSTELFFFFISAF